MEHQLILKKPLAFIDLETTGVSISKDRIVELCIAKAMPNGTVEVRTRRINPTIPIPLEASLIHGIYDEDVQDAPSFKSLAKGIATLLEGCDIAGFNSNRFDIPMLIEEFLRADVDFEMKGRKMIDAQRIYHMMEPRNLSAAYQYYCNKELQGAHGAEADTLATLEVLNAQVSRYKGVQLKDDKGQLYEPVKNDMEALHNLTANKMVDFAGRMTLNAKNEIVFNFGKHAGKSVKEILQKEPNYYEWMMNGDFSLDTKRRLTEIRLSMK